MHSNQVKLSNSISHLREPVDPNLCCPFYTLQGRIYGILPMGGKSIDRLATPRRKKNPWWGGGPGEWTNNKQIVEKSDSLCVSMCVCDCVCFYFVVQGKFQQTSSFPSVFVCRKIVKNAAKPRQYLQNYTSTIVARSCEWEFQPLVGVRRSSLCKCVYKYAPVVVVVVETEKGCRIRKFGPLPTNFEKKKLCVWAP